MSWGTKVTLPGWGELELELASSVDVVMSGDSINMSRAMASAATATQKLGAAFTVLGVSAVQATQSVQLVSTALQGMSRVLPVN